MTTNYWACTCGASGSYPWKDAPKTDEASADYKHNSPKHANCTAGSVNSSTDVEKLTRVMEAMAA
ncbi:hypothetical protein [uncultured Nocardioides sp.]|jgi:hypothetical protein|uniref:hypothetical protein n=1 Tax=uncultured Nocardioides sp. TaxID=198441 RepID=UPI002636E009|nr:hypothetical protein [uncultured Nocardioides sp.]HRD59359.1 hypothetical protein [Nocardioides sp.]